MRLVAILVSLCACGGLQPFEPDEDLFNNGGCLDTRPTSDNVCPAGCTYFTAKDELDGGELRLCSNRDIFEAGSER